MRLRAWWTIALVGLLTVGCGDSSSSSGGGETVSDGGGGTSTPSTTAAADCSQLSSVFTELLNLTNQARRDAGRDALRYSYQLGQASQDYAEELATQDFFAHVGKDGSTIGSRVRDTGYDWSSVGENLAAGQTTAAEAFESWMDSEGHRRNILSESFTEVGFGRFDTNNSKYDRYWVQNFGTPRQGASRSDIYVPDNCGVTVAEPDAASNLAVAGVSEHITDINGHALPGAAQQGTLPTSVLQASLTEPLQASADQSSASTSNPKTVPGPSALLGIALLSTALWQDHNRK